MTDPRASSKGAIKEQVQKLAKKAVIPYTEVYAVAGAVAGIIFGTKIVDPEWELWVQLGIAGAVTLYIWCSKKFPRFNSWVEKLFGVDLNKDGTVG